MIFLFFNDLNFQLWVENRSLFINGSGYFLLLSVSFIRNRQVTKTVNFRSWQKVLWEEKGNTVDKYSVFTDGLPDIYIKKLTPGLNSEHDLQLLEQRQDCATEEFQTLKGPSFLLHIPYSLGDYIKWVVTSPIHN